MNNRFAEKRRRYLREHRDGIYTGMLLTGKLDDHLKEIGDTAQEMFDRLVAGGYYTARHIVNAMRKVVNDHTAPRETLLDYNQTINEEIEKKRAEFELD